MSFSEQWIVTSMPAYPGKQVEAWVRDGRVMQLALRDMGEEQILGNIYIGKIRNIAENIEAAFVEIGGGLLCHVPLEELRHAIYTNPPKGSRSLPGKPRPGDEVLVQVTKEALKTKLPGATGNLSLTGTYLVLTTGKCMLGLSGKLAPARRAQLKESLSDLVTEEYGFIVRTNAADASQEAIRREAALLRERLEAICRTAAGRTCFSCVYRPEESGLAGLRNTNLGRLKEIVTDLPEIRDAAGDFLDRYESADGHRPVLRFYEDAILPLYKLYSLESALAEALKERVWLKSGGYLVIQPTEALTVIDVNTGKFEGHKKAQDTFLKINLEAAREAARQMRLRNLSGIILIDFIDMKEEAARQEVASRLRACLKEDPVKADFVDFTKLGLAEVTRKKGNRPLKEQLKGGAYVSDSYRRG